MKHLSLLYLFLCISLASCSQVFTSAPDYTEAAATLGVHRLQIDGDFIAILSPYEFQLVYPDFLIQYGLSKRLDLRLGLQNIYVSQPKGEDIRGLGDLEVGSKYLMVSTRKFTGSLVNHVVLKTGHKKLSNGSPGIISKVCFTYIPGKTYEIGVNSNYDYYTISNNYFSFNTQMAQNSINLFSSHWILMDHFPNHR